MRVTFVILAAVLIAIGSVIALIGVVGVLDPVGSKHADDSDPFGTPAPRWQAALVSVVGVALISSGVLIAVRASGLQSRSRITPR